MLCRNTQGCNSDPEFRFRKVEKNFRFRFRFRFQLTNIFNDADSDSDSDLNQNWLTVITVFPCLFEINLNRKYFFGCKCRFRFRRFRIVFRRDSDSDSCFFKKSTTFGSDSNYFWNAADSDFYAKKKKNQP